MRKKSDLHVYQQDAITYLYEHDAALALMPLGSGKSAVGWTAAQELMRAGEVQYPLVFAPLRVAQMVWPAERGEWEHLKDEPVVAWGGEPALWPDSPWKTSRQLWGSWQYAESRAYKGLKEAEKADQLARQWSLHRAGMRAVAPEKALHVTSYENLQWLCDLFNPGQSPFDLWIFDEIGKLKNPKSPRYKAVKKHTAKAKIVWGLNATPAPEGYEDLFAQVSIVDGGKVWGKSFYQWREKHFYPVDHMGYKWLLRPTAKDTLTDDLNTIGFRVDESDLSYQKGMQHSQIDVTLPHAALQLYDKMFDDLMVTVKVKDRDNISYDEIVAMSAAAGSMKLRQITQGFLYNESGGAHTLHEEKLHALADLIDSLGQEPLLVAYQFIEDLEAIRKIYKNLPYLGAGVSSAQAADNVARWNRRELPVMALHPNCLHPDTLVLTEYCGWRRIIDVCVEDRVFDGVEFVTHHGCQLSGVRPVIKCLGITMTPDHLILVGNEWMKAKDVRDTEGAGAAALYGREETYEDGFRVLFQLREREGHAPAERRQGEQETRRALHYVRFPSDDEHASLAHMERLTGAGAKTVQPELRELRRAWDRGLGGLAGLRSFLAGYAEWLLGRLDAGAQGRERAVLQRELPLGYAHGTAVQQAEQSLGGLPWGEVASGSFLPRGRSDERRDHAIPAAVQLRGHGHGSIPGLDVPEGPSQPVYDLVDCGPRHRFAVKNAAGEVYIVHNSAGHGLNLQHGGSHLCWYALPWSLEGFEQTCGRVDRQGQTRACYGHHIIAKGTIDERISSTLVAKAAAQSAIIEGVRRLGSPSSSLA